MKIKVKNSRNKRKMASKCLGLREVTNKQMTSTITTSMTTSKRSSVCVANNSNSQNTRFVILSIVDLLLLSPKPMFYSLFF